MARAINENTRKKPGMLWVHVAAMIAVTAWGISFINTKVLLDNGFDPVEVYVLRCIIAYLLLLAFSWRNIRSLNAQHELLFLLCGICGGSVYFVAENAALLYTSATNVSLITSTSPLINALLVVLLYKDERPSKGFIIGSVIAMVGVTMVVLGSAGCTESKTGSPFGILGDGLSLMAAICWSIYALLLRKLQAFYSAIVVTRKTFFYGLLTSLPLLLLEHSHITLETFTRPQVWINLLILALFASSLAFVIWAWVISRMGAVKAGNYLYFQPIVTLIFGYFVLHQAMSLMGLAGCVLTILGVYCGERLSKERRRLHH
ncbi:MAG: DMT family transporter [Bacteroides sp.]|nr:DMT family transporter [Bacteroides sp.]MCM1379828.1 DMT family transporter [Bacteroides sp.]MCM1446187.1 DMT family transporter [Prevotella sp.]